MSLINLLAFRALFLPGCFTIFGTGFTAGKHNLRWKINGTWTTNANVCSPDLLILRKLGKNLLYLCFSDMYKHTSSEPERLREKHILIYSQQYESIL